VQTVNDQILAAGGLRVALGGIATTPRRSGFAFAGAVALHAGLAALLLLIGHRVLRPPPEAPPQLSMVFAPPEPAAAPAPVAEPQQSATEPQPPPAVHPEPAPPPPPTPVPVPAEVAPPPVAQPVPAPRPVAVKPEARPIARPAHRPPAALPRSPPAPVAPSAPAAATAPTTPSAPAIAAPGSADAVAGWRSALAAWLQSHKTYPALARRTGDQGRVVVHFTVDREGRVTVVALVQSSGSAVLDEAAEALLRSARLPPFPAGMAQPQISITLPIRYALEQ